MSAVHVRDSQGNSLLHDSIFEGKFDILFFSPEELLTDLQWRDMLGTNVSSCPSALVSGTSEPVLTFSGTLLQPTTRAGADPGCWERGGGGGV